MRMLIIVNVMIVERTLAGTLLNDHRDTNRLRTCGKAFTTGNLYRWQERRVEISVAFRCVCVYVCTREAGNRAEMRKRTSFTAIVKILSGWALQRRSRVS